MLRKCDFVKLDVTNFENVKRLLKQYAPDVIIHTASIGDVDACERDPTSAWSVNVGGTQNIIKACVNCETKVIFCSSNAVYDGTSPPYDENSPRKPINYYGKTKLEAETIVSSSFDKHVIARLMTMYGWNLPNGRSNPVTWLLDRLRGGQEVLVVDDVYNNHLYSIACAEVIWKIIEREKWGETYNIAGAECLSRYELAVRTAEVFGLNWRLIKPVHNSYFSSIAPRPLNTCYDTRKLTRDLGIVPLKVTEGLQRMKNEMR